MKNTKNSGVEAQEEGVEAEKTTQGFFFPSLNRTIQAESIEEATKIAEKELAAESSEEKTEEESVPTE